MYLTSVKIQLVALGLLGVAILPKASSYPIILQVDEESERCFRFNIPEDDDAHVVFLSLPSEEEVEEDVLESWYVEQVYKMTTQTEQKGMLPRNLPDEAPTNVSKEMSDYLKQSGDNQSNLMIQFRGDPDAARHRYRTKYFLPLVYNNIRKFLTRKGRQLDDDELLEGHEVCLVNDDEELQVQVIFDMILASETGEDKKKGGFEKDKHLTPLEMSLDHSISAANSVLREMKYMEQREVRMRKTADSINSRVRWFSYLSVAVLLVVTYVQVTYLKRYFRKKKLL